MTFVRILHIFKIQNLFIFSHVLSLDKVWYFRATIYTGYMAKRKKMCYKITIQTNKCLHV